MGKATPFLGVLVLGALLGAVVSAAFFLWQGQAPKPTAPNRGEVVALQQRADTLRRSLSVAAAYTQARRHLASEPLGDISPAQLGDGVALEASISAVTTSSIVIDVLTPHEVPDLGTTFQNRHAHLQTLPVTDPEIPVVLIDDPDHPIRPQAFEGSVALTFSEFAEVFSKVSRRQPVYRVLLVPDYQWATPESVPTVRGGAVYMIEEVPVGS